MKFKHSKTNFLNLVQTLRSKINIIIVFIKFSIAERKPGEEPYIKNNKINFVKN